MFIKFHYIVEINNKLKSTAFYPLVPLSQFTSKIEMSENLYIMESKFKWVKHNMKYGIPTLFDSNVFKTRKFSYE